MKVLSQKLNLESFFRTMSRASQRVLMLDYDGTIAPFQVNRMEAFPYPEVNEVLEKIISQRKNRVIIISARQISQLLQLFSLAKKVEIWGCYGLERLTTDGKYEIAIAELDRTQLDGLEKAKELFEKLGLVKQYERKPGCIALHWRGLDVQVIESIGNNVFKPLWDIANKHGLRFQQFNGGLELTSSNRNKGFVVNQILSEVGQEAVLAYLGDDVEDEYAFKAIKNKGLAIVVSSEQKFTEADVCLESPIELVHFFQRWLES